jgi:hypothetical protein
MHAKRSPFQQQTKLNQCNANRCILDTSAGDTCQSASTVKISYLQLPSKFLNLFVLPHAICFKAGNILFSQGKCVCDVTFRLLAAFDGIDVLLDMCVLLFDLCTCSDPVNAARRALIHMASSEHAKSAHCKKTRCKPWPSDVSSHPPPLVDCDSAHSYL